MNLIKQLRSLRQLRKRQPGKRRSSMEDKSYNAVDKHYELCQMLHIIYLAKNKSYGNSASDTFDELGPISSVTRMFDKMKRIVHLTKMSNNDAITLHRWILFQFDDVFF